MTSTQSSSSSLIQSQVNTHIQFSIWHTFKHHIPRFLTTILVDVILPLVIYFVLQKYIKPVYALLVAGTPPFIMVIFKAISSRTFDALGFLVFIGFIISGIVAIITHNPIILLLEKSLVTGIVSIIFAITLIPFHCCHENCRLRPLGYYFYQDLIPINREQIGLPENLFINNQESIDEQYSENENEILIHKSSNKQEVAQVYEWIYINCSSFRIACYFITSTWAVGLLSEFLSRLILILVHLSINKLVIYGNVILSTITVICILITIICVTRERKQTIILIEQWKQEHLNIQ
ncbi:unnamed protein product [Rotaria sp. Silwood1]|nr:unnamed protein product [Rotaria sp. Silwood1]CAF3784201.1 unnamed protein product [Rotaria sp. Silwood1]CAF3804065.1 unnamed protein product [Rotaria sp. Silwood1]CAF4902277.1 unnamed protein product [Rotaria sp. Silwood1]CAF4978340.1 unnamed protein product [Rotaria sp. Silwood1]